MRQTQVTHVADGFEQPLSLHTGRRIRWPQAAPPGTASASLVEVAKATGHALEAAGVWTAAGEAGSRA
jgi:hypothetical protein